MENTTVNEGKSAAIISYIWWIGLIISFIMNSSKKNSFTAFHIRQSLGLLLALSIMNILEWKFGLGWVSWIIEIGLFILWVIALIGAIQGEEKRIPLFGDLFQDWFKSIG